MSSSNANPSPAPVVIVVDDDAAVRGAIRALLDSIKLTSRSFATGQDALDAYDPQTPGCLVLDLRLPDLGAFQIRQRILTLHGYCPPAIIVSGYGDVPTAVRAVKEGFLDFLIKPFSAQELLERVQEGIRLDAAARHQAAQRQRVAAGLAQLTQRERHVLTQLLAGKSNKQIALELGLSTKTVATHRANTLRKLGFESLLALAQVVQLPL